MNKDNKNIFIPIDICKKLKIEHENGLLKTINIMPLSEFLNNKYNKKLFPSTSNTQNIDLGIKAINDFIAQVEYYKKHQLSFGVIEEKNIYVADNNIFLIICDKLLPITEKYYIDINEVYDKKNKYLPPELQSNDILPYRVRTSSPFFSLGKITNDIIFNTPNPDLKQIATLDKSRLFYCLKRATATKTSHRYLLYL